MPSKNIYDNNPDYKFKGGVGFGTRNSFVSCYTYINKNTEKEICIYVDNDKNILSEEEMEEKIKLQSKKWREYQCEQY